MKFFCFQRNFISWYWKDTYCILKRSNILLYSERYSIGVKSIQLPFGWKFVRRYKLK